MHTDVSVSLRASDARIFDFLCDLASFQELIPLVHSVESVIEHGERVWNVELRAKIGPFARSKQLRMVRTVCEPYNEIVFTRVEADGREHAPWALTVKVAPEGTGSSVEIHLDYGGRLWTAGVMERVLRDNIEEGKRRLTAKFD